MLLGSLKLRLVKLFFSIKRHLFFNKKKDEKAKIERQIKNINKIFSDFDALIALIIKYFCLF
tara:strand:- start:489 stop:674 length:186 start_codon:yes stop_codon:yes gene_type:complete